MLANKQLTLFKSHFNSETLLNAINMKPTVLMIYCHGGADPTTISKKITLWAENTR